MRRFITDKHWVSREENQKRAHSAKSVSIIDMMETRTILRTISAE